MAEFHETFGWVAIGLSGAAGVLALAFVRRRDLPQWFWLVGGTMRALLQVLLLGPVVGRLSGTRIKMLGAQARKEDFTTILDWMVSGKLKTTIDRRFPLEQAAEAVRYHGEGRTLGKVLVVL